MNKEHILELNGLKLSVDLSQATRIDTIRVGDRVRLLEKPTYTGGEVKLHHGIVAGFEPFPSQPTIVVAYLEYSYRDVEIKFAYLNAADPEVSKKWEVVPSTEDTLPLQKSDVLASLQRQINAKQEEINDIVRKRDYFLAQFGRYFGEVPTGEQTD